MIVVVVNSFPGKNFSLLRDFFPRMVRMIYRATTMKSSVDIVIALRCGEWSSGIDPRHRRRIIAATIGVGCEKEGGVDQASFLLEKDEDRAG